MKKLEKEFNDNLYAITRIGEDNKEFLNILKDEGIKKLIITSMGNSISTGFSFCDENKPLLDRNALLEIMCEEYGIDLLKYKFARSENNSDQNTFNNIINNLSEEDINALNRRDYEKHLSNGNALLSKEEIEKYYSNGNNTPIRDIIFNNNESTANIVVYNGLTGSFLDNVTRGGKHKLTGGIHKDLSYVDSIMGLIHNNNRENDGNTQVYLCGAPRVLNTSIQEPFMNRHLKQIEKRYPHVTYVDNPSRHMLYKGNFKVDLHYNKNEYLKLTHLIMKSFIDNYVLSSYMIDIDKELYKLNKSYEMNNKDDKDCKDVLDIIGYMTDAISFERPNLEIELLKRTKSYLLERYPYDFFCFNKKAIKKNIMTSSSH